MNIQQDRGDNINNKIIDMIFYVNRLLKRQMSCVVSSKVYQLTLLQLELLIFLKVFKGISMHDIARKFQITMPTATSFLNKLVELGFVQRTGDKNDRRIVKVSLTKSGETILAEGMKYKTRNINKLLSFLCREDKIKMLDILNNISSKAQVYENWLKG